MTSTSSKVLPFLAILIMFGAILFEGYYGIELDLQTLVPIVVTLGGAGAAKAAIEKAAEVRKAIPPQIQSIIDEELKKLVDKIKS